jgi:hypothetical protein
VQHSKESAYPAGCSKEPHVLVLPVAKLRAAIQLAEAAMSIDLNQKMKLARALRTGFFSVEH